MCFGICYRVKNQAVHLSPWKWHIKMTFLHIKILGISSKSLHWGQIYFFIKKISYRFSISIIIYWWHLCNTVSAGIRSPAVIMFTFFLLLWYTVHVVRKAMHEFIELELHPSIFYFPLSHYWKTILTRVYSSR